MKKSLFASILVAALFLSAGALAEDKADDHAAHHPGQAATQSSNKEAASTKGTDMGGMNMDDMSGMMHECMEMHKDGKMCDQKAMQKCQEKMGKGECQKMMRQAKVRKKDKK